MSIYFWILISFYSLGLGFLLGEYYTDNVESFNRACIGAPFEKLFVFLFSPLVAIIWLYVWIKQEFFGRKLK